MIPLTLAEVAAAVGGRLDAAGDGGAVVSTVAIDSRQVEPGALFVALSGQRNDGHQFAAAALAAGAAGVLSGRPVGVPAVVVSDPVGALGRLARAVLDRLPAVTVTGITGSTGKTSTKDLLAGLLSRLGPTVAPPNSFNNEIGLPLTVLRADGATRHLVLEYSARQVGHIAALCAIAPPRLAVELGVGLAHLGVFGSREAIATAKGELVEAVPTDGVALLCADDPLVLAMAQRTAARVVTFGRGAAADVRATDVVLDADAMPSFTLVTPTATVHVTLHMPGEHHVGNALAAASAALELGLGLGEVAEGLGQARPASRWRMQVTRRADGVTVVNDTWNANPDSMAAALRALAAMARAPYQGQPRRSWAVLGEMAELGSAAVNEHEAMGRLAVGLGVARLVAVGAAAEPIVHGAAREGGSGERAIQAPDAAAALELLRAQLVPGDIVLVKASRALGFEQLAAELLEPAQPGPAQPGPAQPPAARSPGPAIEPVP